MSSRLHGTNAASHRGCLRCRSDVVIKLLGSTDPTTCTILDKDGRTPLHLACDIACTIQDENDKCQPQQRGAHSYDVVRALLSDLLVASLVEDEDGMSALEYAIISDASIEVVTLLQKATMESLQERENQRLRKKRRLLDEAGDTTSIGIQQRSVGVFGV